MKVWLKPLALTADEAAAAAAYCRDRDVLLMEAFMYRFHPAWTETRRLVERPAAPEDLAERGREHAVQQHGEHAERR